jgi:hypothetical protein
MFLPSGEGKEALFSCYCYLEFWMMDKVHTPSDSDKNGCSQSISTINFVQNVVSSFNILLKIFNNMEWKVNQATALYTLILLVSNLLCGGFIFYLTWFGYCISSLGTG